MTTSPRTACVEHVGRNSRCGLVAGGLADAEGYFKKVARMANRSSEAYAKYREELAYAKASRDEWRVRRDAHLGECPAAADRFGCR